MERPKRPLVTNIPVAKNEDMHNANKVQLYISELESYADQEHARAERLMGENAELKDQLSDALKGRAGI